MLSSQDPQNSFELLVCHAQPFLGGRSAQNLGPIQRKEEEPKFLSQEQEPWSSFLNTQCGASSLAQNLRRLQAEAIIRYIPTLREKLEKALVECNAKLRELEDGIDTVGEMREALLDLVNQSDELLKAPVDSPYRSRRGNTVFSRKPQMIGTH